MSEWILMLSVALQEYPLCRKYEPGTHICISCSALRVRVLVSLSVGIIIRPGSINSH